MTPLLFRSVKGEEGWNNCLIWMNMFYEWSLVLLEVKFGWNKVWLTNRNIEYVLFSKQCIAKNLSTDIIEYVDSSNYCQLNRNLKIWVITIAWILFNFPIIIRWVLLNNQVIPVQSHKNITARCEICSQLAIKISEQWWDVFLVTLLPILKMLLK